MVSGDVGTLVVVDPHRRPAGMITDRDLAAHCVAEARDPDATLLGDVMATPVVTVPETLAIEDALATMARDGVRRLAVVDEEGRLAGILALDDVIELLAEETTTIGKLLSARG